MFRLLDLPIQLPWVSIGVDTRLRQLINNLIISAERAGISTSDFMDILNSTNMRSDLIMEKGNGEYLKLI